MGWKSVIGILALAFAVTGCSTLGEDPLVASERITLNAQQSIRGFKSDRNTPWFGQNIGRAKAVIIIPQSLKGGFIFGASGGDGVMMVRESDRQTWNGPAFYTIGSVTFGLQAGAEVSEIVLFVMTDRGVDRLLTSTAKIGADLSVAAGPAGSGVKAQTVDVLAFAKSRGLYGGINLEGAVIKVRHDLNEAYYRRNGIRPRDILFGGEDTNPQANGLKQELRGR